MNCEDVWKKYSIIRSLPPNSRHHCPRCGVLLLTTDLAEHEGHGARSGVSDEELSQPTCLVTPREDKKSQAVRKALPPNCCAICANVHSNFTSPIPHCNSYFWN